MANRCEKCFMPPAQLQVRAADHQPSRSYMKAELNENLSGIEVYYANSLMLLVKNMLCNKRHCQKGFSAILFSYKIRPNRPISDFTFTLTAIPFGGVRQGESEI